MAKELSILTPKVLSALAYLEKKSKTNFKSPQKTEKHHHWSQLYLN